MAGDGLSTKQQGVRALFAAERCDADVTEGVPTFSVGGCVHCGETVVDVIYVRLLRCSYCRAAAAEAAVAPRAPKP